MAESKSVEFVTDFFSLHPEDQAFVRGKFTYPSEPPRYHPNALDYLLKGKAIGFLGAIVGGHLLGSVVYTSLGEGSCIVYSVVGRMNKEFIRKHGVSPALYTLEELKSRGFTKFTVTDLSKQGEAMLSKLRERGYAKGSNTFLSATEKKFERRRRRLP